MKNIIAKNRRILKYISALVLFVLIELFAATCEEDEKCKKCTHKEKDETKEFCGDELEEVSRSDSDWTCK
jgi:hypothetical protein